MLAWDGSFGAARYVTTRRSSNAGKAYKALIQDMLPKELVFELHYLGNVEYSYTLNFSRSAAPIIGQFFNFLNLGKSVFGCQN